MWIWIHKMSQFVTILKARKNCSTGLMSTDVKSSNFLSIVYSKSLQENKKPKLQIGERVRISKYGLLFRFPFTLEKFEIFAISSQKPPTYTIKDEQDEIIRCKFYQKELIKVI